MFLSFGSCVSDSSTAWLIKNSFINMMEWLGVVGLTQQIVTPVIKSKCYTSHDVCYWLVALVACKNNKARIFVEVISFDIKISKQVSITV